jgi:hypothetical protein
MQARCTRKSAIFGNRRGHVAPIDKSYSCVTHNVHRRLAFNTLAHETLGIIPLAARVVTTLHTSAKNSIRKLIDCPSYINTYIPVSNTPTLLHLVSCIAGVSVLYFSSSVLTFLFYTYWVHSKHQYRNHSPYKFSLFLHHYYPTDIYYDVSQQLKFLQINILLSTKLTAWMNKIFFTVIVKSSAFCFHLQCSLVEQS